MKYKPRDMTVISDSKLTQNFYDDYGKFECKIEFTQEELSILASNYNKYDTAVISTMHSNDAPRVIKYILGNEMLHAIPLNKNVKSSVIQPTKTQISSICTELKNTRRKHALNQVFENIVENLYFSELLAETTLDCSNLIAKYALDNKALKYLTFYFEHCAQKADITIEDRRRIEDIVEVLDNIPYGFDTKSLSVFEHLLNLSLSDIVGNSSIRAFLFAEILWITKKYDNALLRESFGIIAGDKKSPERCDVNFPGAVVIPSIDSIIKYPKKYIDHLALVNNVIELNMALIQEKIKTVREKKFDTITTTMKIVDILESVYSLAAMSTKKEAT